MIRFKKHQQKMFAKKALSRWRLWCIVLTGKAQDNSAALDFLSDAADCRYLQQSLQLHLLGWPKQRSGRQRRSAQNTDRGVDAASSLSLFDVFFFAPESSRH